VATSRKTASKRSPVLTITAAELKREVANAETVSHDAGATLFREGSEAHDCYMIVKGKVQVLKKIRGGGKVDLAVVEAGGFLGEMAMLSGEKRSASAIALTKVEAIRIQRTDLEALLRSQNPFAGRLSLHLSALLASRCHRLLRLIAHQKEIIPPRGKKSPALDVRAVLNRVYTLWAV
jgi:CRP-like cAMP-binding protein